MFVAVDRLPPLLTYALPFAAGGFLYVAMSDLIPGLHRVDPLVGPVRQLLLILAGIATVVALEWA
jgi:zinc transporter ZupT